MFFSKIVALAAVTLAAVSVTAAPVPMPMAVARRGEQAIEALEVLPMTHRVKRADVNLVSAEIPTRGVNGEIIPFSNPGVKRSEPVEETAEPEVVKRVVDESQPAMNLGDGIVPYKNTATGKRRVDVQGAGQSLKGRGVNTFPSHIAARTDEHGNIVPF